MMRGLTSTARGWRRRISCCGASPPSGRHMPRGQRLDGGRSSSPLLCDHVPLVSEPSSCSETSPCVEPSLLEIDVQADAGEASRARASCRNQLWASACSALGRCSGSTCSRHLMKSKPSSETFANLSEERVYLPTEMFAMSSLCEPPVKGNLPASKANVSTPTLHKSASTPYERLIRILVATTSGAMYDGVPAASAGGARRQSAASPKSMSFTRPPPRRSKTAFSSFTSLWAMPRRWRCARPKRTWCTAIFASVSGSWPPRSCTRSNSSPPSRCSITRDTR
mmetsp:Transcript_107915/g.302242  ORF Transcript_107915/g.302242 Transcript_107915/m.302242 type:complete len:281 (-) Transcript_107915:662-1504(-)